MSLSPSAVVVAADPVVVEVEFDPEVDPEVDPAEVEFALDLERGTVQAASDL